MGGVVSACWCILPAAGPSRALRKAAEDCPSLTALMSRLPHTVPRGLLALSSCWCKYVRYRSISDGLSSLLQLHLTALFTLEDYTVVTDPRLLKRETCLFFWGPSHFSFVCSLFPFVLMAPELLKELFLLLEHYLAVHLIEGDGLVLCWAGSYLCSP